MTDGDDSPAHRETADFLSESPEGESAIAAILEVDSASETWEFEDVPLDSGTFGEIVSRGIVTKDDGAYRLAEPEAVRTALQGEHRPTAASSSDSVSISVPSVGFDASVFGSLIAALVVVVAARTFHYQSVFVSGRVVSPGNDPYFFRYWQEQLLAESSSPFSFHVLVNPPWDDGSFNQRPLTHATNWWFAELLGGGQWGAEMVVAWLPLVFTLLLAVVIYALALVLTRDVRVAFASVLVLALAPVHANYTGLGLLHHRYNQYLWFGVILLTLVWLATDLKRRHEAVGPQQAVHTHIRRRKTWVVAAAFGLSLAFWTHSWGGSLELFAALGVYVGLRTSLDLREGLSPGRANLPLVFGFGTGALLALALHLGLGWHGLASPLMAVIAFTGVVVFVGLGELWHRRDLSVRKLLATQAALTVLGAVVVAVVLAALTDVMTLILSVVTPSSAPAWQTSVQSGSLYTTDLFVLFGPVGHIGLEFYLALGALVWCLALVYREYEPGWLLVAVVTVHYLILSGVMVRFAGRLVIVMAVLGGLSIVFVLAWLDLVRTPRPLSDTASQRARQSEAETGLQRVSIPDVPQSIAILGVCVMIFGASLLFLPTLMNQVTHDEAHVETAMEIAEHAESLDREQPDDHVLAPWRQYRLYNYFVSGESESERLGRYVYPRLTQGEHPEANMFRNQAGYVVLSGLDVSEETEHERLSEHLGQEGEHFESLEHYQLLYVDTDAGLAVFTLVPGVTIEIEGYEDDQVHVETDVTVADRTFVYERQITAGDDGTASVTVPYPGTYDVAGTTVTADEEAVETGDTVTISMDE